MTFVGIYVSVLRNGLYFGNSRGFLSFGIDLVIFEVNMLEFSKIVQIFIVLLFCEK